MNTVKISKYNYFERTFGQFHIVKNVPECCKEKPDFISYSKKDAEKVSSEYWYTEKGLYRKSDHWKYVATCRWFLNEKPSSYDLSTPVLAFCSWKSMKEIEELPDSDIEILKKLSKRDLSKIVIKTSFGDRHLRHIILDGIFDTMWMVDSNERYVLSNSYSPIKIIIK